MVSVITKKNLPIYFLSMIAVICYMALSRNVGPFQLFHVTSKFTWLWMVCISIALATLISLRKTFASHSLIATLSLVFLVTLFIYKPFLTGEVSYLYTTYDGFSQYLPTYANFARVIREGTSIPWWTFTIGLGHIQSYDVLLYPLNAIPSIIGAILGNHALEMSFGWMQLIKIILSSLFMYLFLFELKFSRLACSIAAILFGFCGIIILRGNWIFLADECYIAMFILWSAERYIKRKEFIWIPISIFLLGSCLGLYYLYLYALLLTIYVTIRFFCVGCSIREYPLFILKCGALYLIGVLMGSMIFIGFGWSLFSTARYSSTLNSIHTSEIFRIANFNVLFSSLARLFSTDSMGVYSQYSGTLNFLEGPLFYSGLCCFFIIPQAFVSAKKRQKILISSGIGAAFIYMLFPFITDIMNAFIRNEEFAQRSYRLSSLWICILIIVICAYGFDIIIKTKKINQKVLIYSGITVISTFFLMYILMLKNFTNIEDKVYVLIFAFLISWLITFGFYNGSKKYIVIVMSLIVLESGLFSYVTIRGSYFEALGHYQSMVKDDAGYYKDYASAVTFIQNQDKSFYRIGGAQSVSGVANLSAPQYFGIFGSSYYTSIDSSTYEFLNTVYPESFYNNIGSKYSNGVGHNLYLSQLTGYKYLILRNKDADVPQNSITGGDSNTLLYGYDYLSTVGNLDVYRNKAPLSIGFTYDKYISKSEFLDLSTTERQVALLSCIVLEDGVKSKLQQITQNELKYYFDAAKDIDETIDMNWYDLLINARSQEQFEVTNWKEDWFRGTINSSSDKMLFLSIPNVKGWSVWVDGEKTETQIVNVGFLGVPLSKGQHVIELKYRSETQLPGFIISILVISMFILLIVFRKKLNWFDPKVSLDFNEDQL